MPAYIHAPIPGHLLNTACGNLLAQRLIREEWVEPPWERSREQWAKTLYRDSPGAEKLKFQTNLKIKKSSPVVDRFCNSCLQPLTKKSALKFMGCYEVRYCSKGCQVSDWAEHKKDCVPPKPKLPRTVLYMCQNTIVHGHTCRGSTVQALQVVRPLVSQ